MGTEQPGSQTAGVKEFAGALYHVTARGNERRDIFLGDTDGDRAALLNVLGATCERFNWLIHA
jgi:REP element-mobilizing transposase RayT